MSIQRNASHPRDYETSWEYHDWRRNHFMEEEKKEDWEKAEDAYIAKTKAECRALWEIQRKKIQHNVSNPMPCTHPRAKLCFNDRCGREVSWQWGDGKNWCCGDRCVETLMPNSTHKMKMNCIRMELQRYWNDIERQLGDIALEAVSTPEAQPVPFSFDSPTSVGDIEQDGMFSMEDILPMDFDEFDLYCYESLSSELKEVGCDDLLLD